MQAVDIPLVASFDREVFGADRSELITRLYRSCPEIAWLFKEKNGIAGFCMGRPGQNFTQIGPLNALSKEVAETLIRSAINQLGGQGVVVDIPEDKPDTRDWLEANGFKTIRPFERMYLRENPHPGLINNLYLIAGPELG